MADFGAKPCRGAQLRALVLLTGLTLAGCGQKGPLYLPDSPGEVVTRPTATPPPETTDSSNSPQSVDSPPAPPNPAPEVTEPEPSAKDKQKKDGAGTPPPR
jgi:predicted small lipoprotein YifL